MARYIDAGLITQYFDREEWKTPDEKWWPEREIGMIVDSIPEQDALKIIDNYIDGSFEWGAMMLKIKRLPTAYVVPVVHGEWKDGICTNCKCGLRETWFDEPISYANIKYCPYCGADMRGGTDEL